MKCPKCSYVSHDYLNTCRKCTTDLSRFKAQVQLYVVRAGNVDLRTAVSSMPAPNIAESGEFDLGGVLFEETPAVGADNDGDVFDINLEDDFNFTPSGMSLESLDGFEVSNLDMLEAERQFAAETGDPGDAPDQPGADAPDTGYATVMMDISGLSDAPPPPAPDPAPLDAPIGLADPAPVEPPAPPEPSHGAAPTAIFDLQDNDPLAPPNDAIPWDNTNNERLDTLPDGFQAPVENAGVMPEPAEELILPSIDDAQLASNSSASSTGADDAFTMPDLPDFDLEEDEESLNPSEEFSLDVNPADPGPPPMDFPSIQSVVAPSQASDIAPVQEALAPEAAPPPDAGRKTTYEVNISDIQAPDDLSPSTFDNTQPPSSVSPHEATFVDEPSPFAAAGPDGDDADPAPKPRSETYEVDLSDIQTADESAWPNLPERTDAFVPSSPHASTIVDEPSPFAATGHNPAEPPAVNEVDDDPDAPSSQARS